MAHTENPEAATREWAARPMRYLEEPTARLAFFEHGTGGRLVLSIHHMTADGGGIKAAGAVLASLLCRLPPDPPASDDRALMRVARSLVPADIPVLTHELIREGLSPLSMLRVQELRHTPPTGSGDTTPHWVPVRLTGERARRFVAASKARGGTINDAMVACVARMAARRGDRGPVMVAYTVDLRRYLRRRRAQVTNLAGVSMVLLERPTTTTAPASIDAVVAAIGEQKRRLTGLAYALLPSFTFSWLPHALMRRVGALIIGQILKRFHRAIAITNIGALDDALAPFGDDLVSASVTGPFIHRNRVPIVTVTGLRGELTLQVVSTHTHSRADLEAFAAELDGLLTETVEMAPA